MRETRIIPATPIWNRYKRLRKAPQSQRLEEAKRLVEHPEGLADEFADSVKRFESYDNIDDHFYPSSRAKRDFAPAIKRTNDLVLRLEAQGILSPVDAPSRLTEHDANSEVASVRAELLACDYVDRELLVQRTTSPATWDDGSRNVGGLRLDLLLADRNDRTPIVGELKLPGDMDPFFALIQALACAAHLSTIHQYERMRRHLERGNFPERSEVPRLDVWVLSVQGDDYDPAKRPKGRYLGDLHDAARRLAPSLLAQANLNRFVRRIAWLRMKLNEHADKVEAEVAWAWGGREA